MEEVPREALRQAFCIFCSPPGYCIFHASPVVNFLRSAWVTGIKFATVFCDVPLQQGRRQACSPGNRRGGQFAARSIWFSHANKIHAHLFGPLKNVTEPNPDRMCTCLDAPGRGGSGRRRRGGKAVRGRGRGRGRARR